MVNNALSTIDKQSSFQAGLCFFAWITASICWLLTYTFVSKGSARHAWDVPLALLNDDYMKKQFAATVVGTCATWAAKACILSLYIRIFSTIRWIRITCYTLMTVIGLYYLSSLGVWIAFCVPRKGTTWATTELTEVDDRQTRSRHRRCSRCSECDTGYHHVCVAISDCCGVKVG